MKQEVSVVKLGISALQGGEDVNERRCKDLCLYLDVLTRNMPRYEKRAHR
jgi:hypothetical protein